MNIRSASVLVLVLLAAPARSADDLPAVTLCGQSRSTAARLAEADKLLKDKKYPETVTLLQAIIDSSGSELVPLNPERSVQARRLCHFRLCHLPPAALQVYRERAEPQARKWLTPGVAGPDGGLLRKVVDEAFCTRAAQKALDLLGDLAFERGQFVEAESWWQMFAPLEPDREETGQLSYPDPEPALVARVQAKQVLARVFRKAPGWKADLEAYRKRFPDAEGTLAGRKGKYADLLVSLSAEREKVPPLAAESWRTFGGGPGRGAVAPSVKGGDAALPAHLGRLCRAGPTWRFGLEKRQVLDAELLPLAGMGDVEKARRLAFFPVVVWPHALVADARYVTAYDLRSGKAEVWYDAAEVNGGIEPDESLPAPEDLRYTLTVSEGRVFARLGLQKVADIRPHERKPGVLGGKKKENTESILVCLGLKPGPGGERRRWMVRAIDPGRKEHAVFEGAPVVAEGRVAVAATRFEGDRVVTAIHCYAADPEDSEPPTLWRADVCETRELEPARPGPVLDKEEPGRSRRRHHLLTVAGDKLVYCSHSGAIVALDLRSGQRLWARRYPRLDVRDPADAPQLRDLSPVVFAEGRLYAAPNDSDRLLCLDPRTGDLIWERRGVDVVHLLGVGQGRLIFTTRSNPGPGRLQAGGLRAVGAADGSDDQGWSLPDDGGGLSPFGRGLLVGDMVLWPTTRAPYGVFAVRQSDGRQVDNPTLLHRIPSGNLTWAHGCLIVTGLREMWAFVPPGLLVEEKEAAAERSPGPQELLDLGRALADSGSLGRASEVFGRAEKAAGELPEGERREVKSQEARGGRRQVDLGRALEALRARQFKEAEALFQEAMKGAAARERLRGLVSLAEGWEEMREAERARKVWQQVLADRTLAEQAVEEGDGTPRMMGLIPHPPRPPLSPGPLGEARTRGEGGASPWQSTLRAGEHFLQTSPIHASVYSSQPSGQFRSCSTFTGKLEWATALPFRATWAVPFEGKVLAAGPGGIAALQQKDGSLAWLFLPPPQGIYPGAEVLASSGKVLFRIAMAPTFTEDLGAFRLSVEGSTLVCLLGERRLLALDARTGHVRWHRWAPGAAFGSPWPRGRFNPLFYLDARSVIAQVSGRCWLLDAVTGELKHSTPAPLDPWVREVGNLGEDRVCLVPDSRTVACVDSRTGKVAWTWKAPGTTTRSGEAPLALCDGKHLLVVLPENIGYRLHRLDPRSGKDLWSTPPLLNLDRLNPQGWVLAGGMVYHEARGHVLARSLADGKVAWDRPLPASGDRGPWALVWLGSARPLLAAWQVEASQVRFQFRWLWGAVQWRGGPLLDRTRSLVILDPTGGAVVQQKALEPARGDTNWRFVPRGLSVWPVIEEAWRGPAPEAGLRVGAVPGRGGVVVELGGRIWGLWSDARE